MFVFALRKYSAIAVARVIYTHRGGFDLGRFEILKSMGKNLFAKKKNIYIYRG